MAKTSSSVRWMNEHLKDEFVKKAQKEGYRSRAAYKLLEIIDKDQIIKSGFKVLDLGAAPGGWSQVAIKIVGKKGQVIATDILPIESIVNVEFLQGDFTEEKLYEKLLSLTKEQKINVVLSDMAPNMSGQISIDQPKSIYLAELALDMATKVLSHNGHFVVKIFQGDGFDIFIQNTRKKFKKVVIRKPKASRPRSKEVYLIASQLK
ncbi:MAG: 23S rRNA (uridine(2552)-2'-O)-methyltransferase RlmE [Gammaproteobacteria bacterium]|nr:23S rRNA (uridine(2552)-2'-O)-methyltransferase RlmE [Gammaproteobacteria bacterium]MDP6973570.1 23S rRNA (uridine(2552)-2'-O)-methyltransferase RlmE [Gammaproteobacteria bacterium]